MLLKKLKELDDNKFAAEYDGKILLIWLIRYFLTHGYLLALYALAYASRKHASQKRRDGQPFINHPMHVAKYCIDGARVCNYKVSQTCLIVALLHDVCEECNIPPEELPFPRAVREKVKYLTLVYDEALFEESDMPLSRLPFPDAAKKRRKKSEVDKIRLSYKMNLKMIYFHNIGDDPEVLYIKIMDRLHNTETMVEKLCRAAVGKNLYETRDMLIRECNEALGRYVNDDIYEPLCNAVEMLSRRNNEIIKEHQDALDDFIKALESGDVLIDGGVNSSSRRARKMRNWLDVHHLIWTDRACRKNKRGDAARKLRSMYAVIMDIDVHRELHAIPILHAWERECLRRLPGKLAMHELWLVCRDDEILVRKYGINGLGDMMAEHLLRKICEVEAKCPELSSEYEGLKEVVEIQLELFKEHIGEF